jgi:hypothetical protein
VGGFMNLGGIIIKMIAGKRGVNKKDANGVFFL